MEFVDTNVLRTTMPEPAFDTIGLASQSDVSGVNTWEL